jgi:hypothetical protein
LIQKIFLNIILILISLPAFSQVPPTVDFNKDLIDKIKIEAINSKDGISGDVIVNDMNPATSGSGEEECLEDNDKDKNKEKKKELVLIFTGEINSRPNIKVNGSDVSHMKFKSNDFSDKKFHNILQKDSQDLLQLASELTENPDNRDQVLSNFGGLLLLGAKQKFDPSKLEDYNYNDQVNSLIASKISSLNLSKKEQINLISSILSSLNTLSYNDARNVTLESDNKPRYWTSQAEAVFGGGINYGGVCDDIAMVGCQLYQALNPDQDCFTMHQAGMGGSQHFVMLIGENGTDNYTTINYGEVQTAQGRQYLTQSPRSTDNIGGGINIRLNRYMNGKHQSVAVTKSEYGRWIQQMMDVKGSPGSSLVNDLDGVVLQNLGAAFEKNVEESEKNKKDKTFKYGVNQGTLSGGANVVAVYALLDKTTARQKMGIGLAYASSFSGKSNDNNFTTRFETNFMGRRTESIRQHSGSAQAHHLHLNPYYGLGRSFDFKHGPNQFRIHYLNGVYANFLAGYESRKIETLNIDHNYNTNNVLVGSYQFTSNTSKSGIIFDGNLGLSQQMGLSVKNDKSRTEANVGVQLTEEFGPSDWGRTHGLRNNFSESMKNMTFFLNRVEVNAQLKQGLNEKTRLLAGTQYLGTNVGSKFLTEFGFEFDIPKDVQIFVLTGYGTSSGGFNSNQDFLPTNNNEGLGVRAGVKTKKGVKINTSVRYNPSNSTLPVNTQLNAIIPIGIKDEKQPKKLD